MQIPSVLMDIWTKIIGSESAKLNHFFAGGDMRLVTSGISDCMNSVDLFGRALSIDNAYRHLTTAEQYLLDANKMQDSAPHTDVGKTSLDAIVRAKEWLRPYAVSPDTASCRDPPVCKVIPPATPKRAGLDDTITTLPFLDSFQSNRKDWKKFLF